LWDRAAWTGQKKEPSPALLMGGHEGGVTALAVTPTGLVLSGSIDRTAQLWDPRMFPPRIQKFVGHQYPIWGVAVLDSGDCVTASGDRTIKIWDPKTGQVKHNIPDHPDTVRGICNVPGLGFLSCCNDFVVRLYSYDGSLLHNLIGHENFVFSSRLLHSGEFATAADDASIRIWKDFECTQILRHPVGLWEVCQIDNGDIIGAGQDSQVYVWTKSSDRKAANSSTEVFNAAVSANLVKMEEAKKPQKEHLDGKEYDVVIPIEFDERPALKLGYNLGENPYTVAQEFCVKYKLNIAQCKEPIAKHIIQLTKQYQTGPSPDYDTSGNAPAPAPAKPKVTYKFLKTANDCAAFTYETAQNFAGLESKIKEFNAGFLESPDTASIALTEDEMITFGLVVGKLTKTNMYHALSFLDQELSLAQKLIQWPNQKLFPVLDLLRLWTLHRESAQYFALDAVFMATVVEKGLLGPGPAANPKLTLWFLGNLTASAPVESYPEKYAAIFNQCCVQLAGFWPKANEATGLIAACVGFNFAKRGLTSASLHNLILSGLRCNLPANAYFSLLTGLGITVLENRNVFEATGAKNDYITLLPQIGGDARVKAIIQELLTELK